MMRVYIVGIASLIGSLSVFFHSRINEKCDENTCHLFFYFFRVIPLEIVIEVFHRCKRRMEFIYRRFPNIHLSRHLFLERWNDIKQIFIVTNIHCKIYISWKNETSKTWNYHRLTTDSVGDDKHGDHHQMTRKITPSYIPIFW